MGKHILVVDDNLTNLKQINTLLASYYDVSLAKSGAMALKICERDRPDMILLDIEMPDMDGFETIARLKRHSALRHIPVIFLTSNRDTATEIRALESGAMDFVTKPPNKGILLHRIELHLQFSAYQLSLENTVKELENSIVTSFAELVDLKDKNTGDHLLDTGMFVDLLGQELLAADTFAGQLNESNLEMIVRATPFHDVGKIGVSDNILLKPEPLTDDEYNEVKKHTTIGARVIETIYNRTPELHYLKYAMLIARGHHEKYDGTGYPSGLAGNEIPLCARIVSVANEYNACMTDRTYRKSLSHEDACRVILSGRGTEFDPLVIKAFEAVCEKPPKPSTMMHKA